MWSEHGVITVQPDEEVVNIPSLDPFFDHAVARVAPNAMSRKRREDILNDHALRLRRSNSMAQETLSRLLSVMIRLMSVSNATAEIVSDF